MIDKAVEFIEEDKIFKNQQWSTYIFEGAQGILLDIDFGTKPHVTKSNTTSKNAMEMLHQHFELDELDIEIYYVSRSYLTRHGEGPFDRSFGIPVLQNTEFETNVENGFQGKFRTAFLNLNLLHKALYYDNHFTQHLPKNLLVTCMDQLITSQIPIIIEEKLVFVNYEDLQNHFKIDFKSFKLSYGPRAIDIREVI